MRLEVTEDELCVLTMAVSDYVRATWQMASPRSKLDGIIRTSLGDSWSPDDEDRQDAEEAIELYARLCKAYRRRHVEKTPGYLDKVAPLPEDLLSKIMAELAAFGHG